MNEGVPRIRLETNEAHLAAIVDAARHGGFMQGQDLRLFSDELKRGTKRSNCLLTSNGFSALFLMILAKGWQRMPIAIPAAGTCFAVVNAIRSSGNIPVFVDNDPDTAGMNIVKLLEMFDQGHVKAAILPTHFGLFQSVDALVERDVPFFEDNAQSAMSVWRYGANARDFVLSFYPTKNLNGIDGGAIVTDDPNLYAAAADRVYYDQQTEDEAVERYNFRMSNINAAFARVSLGMLGEQATWLSKVMQAYDALFAQHEHVFRLGKQCDLPCQPSKYVLRFNSAEMARKFASGLGTEGIGVSEELSMLCFDKEAQFEGAAALVGPTLSIPFRESLKENEVGRVLDACSRVLRDLGR